MKKANKYREKANYYLNKCSGETGPDNGHSD